MLHTLNSVLQNFNYGKRSEYRFSDRIEYFSLLKTRATFEYFNTNLLCLITGVLEDREMTFLNKILHRY